MHFKFGQRFLFISILLLTFALRIIAIDQLPAGLSHDEAYNGITAMQVLDGQWAIFFEINKGIEPLIIYLEALAFYFFGIGPIQLRLVNLVFGVLTVALLYPFTVRLFNQRVALLAQAGLAISFWAIFVSRLTLRAILLPPFLLLTLYFFWRALQPRTQSPTSTLIFFALSGLAAGITMYTYLASRFVPFILITLFGYQLICRQINKTHCLGLLLHFLIWAIIFIPLGNYFWDNYESFTHRSNQVTTIPHALNGDFEPLWENTWLTLGMFTFQGDTTDRYNLDGRPVFDWLNSFIFYLGLALILWRLLRSPRKAGLEVLLLSSLFFMLLPDFITDDSPHFLRSIGVLPLIYMLWAVGLDFIIQQIEKRFAAKKESKFLRQGLVPSGLIILLLATMLHSSYDYFNRWATSAGANYIYGADIAEIAAYIKNSGSNDLTVISAEYYQDLDPFRFRLHFQGHPPFVIWFDGRQTLAFPPTGSNLSPRYAFPTSAPPAELWTNFLEAVPAESGRNYALYRLPNTASLQQFQQLFTPIEVNINQNLQLLGYQILGKAAIGGKFQILLNWRALQTLPPGTDYTFLVKMQDKQGNLWAEADGNGYAPPDWQPGVQALQLLTLRLPQDLPADTFKLSVEVINRRTGQTLPTSTGDSPIWLETMTVKEN